MPTWQDFQPFIVAGLALGGVYALSGVGMVVLYRATGVLNLSFGAVGAMGAFIAWSLINSSGVPDAIAYIVCVAFGGIVTLVYGVLFGPPLASRDPLVKAVATLGLALILLGLMSWIWSDKARSMDLPTSNSGFLVGEVQVNWTQVIALVFGILLTFVTAAFLRYTNLGTAMRALANDREITATLGVPVRRVEAAAWLGSGLVSGFAGLLLSNLVGLDAATLTFLIISSLAAALIARLRSLVVTLVAGLVVGLVTAMVTPILSISEYRDMAPFVLAIVALLYLSGTKSATSARGASRCRQPSSPVVASLSAIDRATRVRIVVIAALLAVLIFALPPLLSLYWIDVLTATAIYSVVALGLGLLMGRVGLVSLGQIAILALGAWVAARLDYATAIPFPLIILLAGLITMVLGTAVGLPALRLSGLYLALITLMLAGAITVVLTATNFPNGGSGFLGHTESATGSTAIRRPAIAQSDPGFFRYVVVVSALMFLLALWHIRAKPGRAWAAIRQSEPAALAAGVNITLYKLWAFALASFMTGAAGALLGANVGKLYTFQFPTRDSIILLAVVLMGGIYSLWGAVVAGIFMRLLPAVLDSLNLPADLLTILFGVGVLQVLLTAPAGLAAQMPKDLARLWGFVSGATRRRAPAEESAH